MKTQLNVLAMGSGIIEENGMFWANAHVLDEEVHAFDDGQRQEKGVKVAKIKLDSSNENALAKRFFNETFPAIFTLDLQTTVKKGELTVTIVNFISNNKSA